MFLIKITWYFLHTSVTHLRRHLWQLISLVDFIKAWMRDICLWMWGKASTSKWKQYLAVFLPRLPELFENSLHTQFLLILKGMENSGEGSSPACRGQIWGRSLCYKSGLFKEQLGGCMHVTMSHKILMPIFLGLFFFGWLRKQAWNQVAETWEALS